MKTKFVHLVGVELEGGWCTQERPNGFVTDGSVTVAAVWPGEVRSPALELDDLLSWIKADSNYPKYVDSSCGLHVHVSTVDNSVYASFMEKAYNNAFLETMEKWAQKEKLASDHPFWPRWRGENRYCSRNFDPHRQALATGKSEVRYTQLNYCHSLHGTLECRMLPMFTKASQAVSAVREFVTFTESWLKSQKPKPADKKGFRIDLGPLPREERYSVAV